MRVLAVMQFGWVATVLFFAAVDLVTGHLFVGGTITLIGAVYIYATVALLRRERWAWWLCVVPPIISLAAYGPKVGYNLWRASQVDPLFSDSPGTLIVVLIMAFVYVIPPVILLVRLAIMRKDVSPNNALEANARPAA
jgi:hypothetical protein